MKLEEKAEISAEAEAKQLLDAMKAVEGFRIGLWGLF